MSSTSTHDDPLESSLPQKRAAPKASLLLHRSAQLLKNTETASKPATSTVSQSRTRGGREVDDDNGEDDNNNGAHVVPQHPEPTCQTAVDEPADTSNPNPTSTRPTVPVGKSNGPSSEGVEGSGEWGVGRKTKKDDSGGEDVRHVYVVSGPTSSPPDEAIRPLISKSRIL
ncbi:hypothetical protein PAXINDRAFT_14754 [Paxillus involutus ATCC 200175]|uniref:Uncharacterized protein n=1 Tax=Paxillus involutus ATCC 200175 TaxID=664439 RepID=A0A0C9T9X2_PAXIN|nr:hypothetical protein PAXINDRAFT_14754 [Paxillus involutus ATCC 200175]